MKADALIARGQQSEKAGDPQRAALLYRSWLRLNQGAPGAARVFASYFKLEQDFTALLETGAAFIASAHGLAGAADQIARVARLFELAGRLEESRNAYRVAFAEGFGDEALVDAFLLSLEMNDADGMQKILQDLPPGDGSAPQLLRALSSFQTGDLQTARTALLEAANRGSDPELSLKALWVLYKASLQRSPAETSLYQAQFASRYAGSPEAAIAAGHGETADARGAVVASPMPLLFAAQFAQSPDADPGAAPATAPPAAQQTNPQPTQVPAKTFSVQAGSFQVKENADDLVNELAKAGFTPSIVHDTTGGRERFRVLAGTGLDQNHAREMLARLSKAGFTGLVVADK